MRTKLLLMVGVILFSVMTSSCRLPVDVNLDRYPDLKLVIHKLDGSPFPGVSCKVLDPEDEATSNGNGEVTLMVYRDGQTVAVTFTFWQNTPDGTRQATDTKRFALKNRGLNVYNVTLQDRALY